MLASTSLSVHRYTHCQASCHRNPVQLFVHFHSHSTGRPQGRFVNRGSQLNQFWKTFESEKMGSHYEHPIYKLNCGSVTEMSPLPLPPADGMSARINGYEDVPEPRFDPKIHLNLERPEWIRLLPDFEKTTKLPKVDSSNGSPFAYSAPFNVLSEEGVKVMREIALRNEKYAVGPENARGFKMALRGLYYLSPFVRDFQNCKELKEMFKKVVGEELIPHPSFSNVPQVNLSVVDNYKRKNIPMDPWHWDSVAYTGVILLNDMDGLVGGELEVMDMDKQKGLQMLQDDKYEKGVHSSVINYERPGKMILAQGSEILHHVTPVLSKHRRISMIMAYASANPYQPPKTVLQSLIRVDKVHQLAEYEFFREKAWQCSHALKGYTENVKYTTDGKKLAEYLRVVAEELERSAGCLDGSVNDMIDYFDEVNKKVCSNYSELVRDHQKS